MIDYRAATFAVCLLTVGTFPGRADESRRVADYVVPVDWTRLESPARQDDDLRRSAEILLNAARYNLGWAPGAADRIERDWRELKGVEPHNVIRPACEAAYALAVVLKTGIFDEEAVGVSEAEARQRTVRLIQVTAAAHNRASWKYA
jgi:hypothetical protein